jgi:Ser/Thr protein kinase RdoA (MazF antagonist)
MNCTTGQYLVRVHRNTDRTPLSIEAELSWLDALSQESAVTVQRPHRSPTGKRIIVVDGPRVPAPYPITVLSWLKGRTLAQDRRSPHHFTQLGRLVAKLHNHSQSYGPPSALERPVYCADSLFGSNGRLWDPEYGDLTSEARDDLQRLHERLSAVEEQLGNSGELFGIIHSDLSFGNVLFTSQEAMPIDFDECGFGCYLFDLAVILAGPWQRPGFQARCNALLHGYREIRNLDDELLTFIPTFMATRAALLGQWQRVRVLLNLSTPLLI